MKKQAGLALSAVTLTLALSGCSALEDAPISNSKHNKNPAIKTINPYENVASQAGAQGKAAERKRAEEKASAKAKKKAEEAKKKARKDPVGTRNDMKPAAASSDVPAWVTAVNWAQTKLGHKYVWGGESDAEGGFDCSGLTQAAYAQAGVRLPRVAQDQYRASRRHPGRSELQPGDLVFYGTSANIHHVGIYVGSGMMLHAPNSRSVIRFDKITYMSDYYGATRVG